jgi:acyl carrier protein
MDRSIILGQLNEIFIDVIDEDAISLKEASTAKEVEGWDSLTHIQLVVAIEKQFKIRFTSKEIQEWKNVGELIDSIINKLTI